MESRSRGMMLRWSCMDWHGHVPKGHAAPRNVPRGVHHVACSRARDLESEGRGQSCRINVRTLLVHPVLAPPHRGVGTC
eukprot:5532404-Prymnesium_polylepis.2